MKAEFFAGMKEQRQRSAARAAEAKAAMPLLVAAMRNKTGQSYHLRALLYSLWNGQPASLLEVVNLDDALRDALLKVVAAFGGVEFFYDELAQPITAAGLFDWFVEEGDK